MIRTRNDNKEDKTIEKSVEDSAETSVEIIEAKPISYKIYAKLEINSNLVNSFYCSSRSIPEKGDVCVVEKKLMYGPERDFFIYENDGLRAIEEFYKPSFWSEDEQSCPMFVIHKYKVVDGQLQETTIEEKDKESLPIFYQHKISRCKHFLDTEWRWKNERYNAELLEIDVGLRVKTTQTKEEIMLLRKNAVEQINYYESLIEQLKEEK